MLHLPSFTHIYPPECVLIFNKSVHGLEGKAESTESPGPRMRRRCVNAVEAPGLGNPKSSILF